jgi:hypothetical protein
MWLSHRGHWRSASIHRAARERAADVLWWTVVLSTLSAAIAYAIYLS